MKTDWSLDVNKEWLRKFATKRQSVDLLMQSDQFTVEYVRWTKMHGQMNISHREFAGWLVDEEPQKMADWLHDVGILDA